MTAAPGPPRSRRMVRLPPSSATRRDATRRPRPEGSGTPVPPTRRGRATGSSGPKPGPSSSTTMVVVRSLTWAEMVTWAPGACTAALVSRLPTASARASGRPTATTSSSISRAIGWPHARRARTTGRSARPTAKATLAVDGSLATRPCSRASSEASAAARAASSGVPRCSTWRRRTSLAPSSASRAERSSWVRSASSRLMPSICVTASCQRSRNVALSRPTARSASRVSAMLTGTTSASVPAWTAAAMRCADGGVGPADATAGTTARSASAVLAVVSVRRRCRAPAAAAPPAPATTASAAATSRSGCPAIESAARDRPAEGRAQIAMAAAAAPAPMAAVRRPSRAGVSTGAQCAVLKSAAAAPTVPSS